jgi:crotonobetainyl-CoA:carnitine CoA-transferase CaiB-like acyl-CoA transferase
MRKPFAGLAYGPPTLVGSGFRLAEGSSGSIDRAPPLVGEHTDEILAEAGYGAGEIETLREEGVVHQSRPSYFRVWTKLQRYCS